NLVSFPFKAQRDKPLRTTGVEGNRKNLPPFLNYDPKRFTLAAETDVLAVADRFGQVAIFDCTHELVCMFFAFRDRLAAWMPDGTRFGPAAITGGPPTPDALDKLGRALRAASEAGRRLSCR